MVSHIGAGRPDLAAELAMQNPNFYNVVIKDWVTPWTNEEGTVFVHVGFRRGRRECGGQ